MPADAEWVRNELHRKSRGRATECLFWRTHPRREPGQLARLLAARSTNWFLNAHPRGGSCRRERHHPIDQELASSDRRTREFTTTRHWSALARKSVRPTVSSQGTEEPAGLC